MAIKTIHDFMANNTTESLKQNQSTTIINPGPQNNFIVNVITVNSAPSATPSDSNNKNKAQSIKMSQNSDHCCQLFHILKPLLYMCKLFGIFPFTFNKFNCEMSHKWISLPGLYNLICFVSITLLSYIINFYSMDVFARYVTNGTDYYTFYLVFVAEILSTVVIFLCGNFNADNFCKTWNNLHSALENVEIDRFPIAKRLVYIIPIYMFEEFIVVALMLISSPVARQELGFFFLYFLVPSSMFITNFVPNLLSSTYIVICVIIGRGFRKINEQIKQTMKEEAEFRMADKIENSNISGTILKPHQKLKKLKNSHEHFHRVVRYMEKAFGFQLLAIFAASCFAFVSGVYGFILMTQGLHKDSLMLGDMSASFSLGSIIGGLRILFVIISSQYLMNMGNSPIIILNTYEEPETHNGGQLTTEFGVQVNQFLSKLGHFPVKVTCCDVFALSTGFIASAATNLVTYVLVLMQFRLDKYNNQTAISES